MGVARAVANFKGGTTLAALLQTLSTSVVIQLLNIGTGVLTARTLAPQGRGDFAAMTMWPQFLGYALTLGLPAALLYRIRRAPERAGQFIGASLVIGLLSGVAAMAIGVLWIPHWLRSYSSHVVLFAQWTMLTAPLATIAAILTAATQADQKFGRLNRYRVLQPVLTLVGLVIVLLKYHVTPTTAALVYIFAGMPALFWNALWVFRRFDLSLRAFSKSIGKLVSYGLRAWGMDLIGTISDQVDKVLVVGLLAPRDLGLYVVALSSARIFAIIPGAICTVLMPKLITLGPERGVVVLTRTAGGLLVFMFITSAPLIMFAGFALKLVYGSDFYDALGVFRVFLIEACFGGVTWLLAQGYSAFGRPGRSTIQQSVGLSAAVPLLLFLVPMLGLAGAAYAILASTLLRLCFALFSYQRLFSVRLLDFVPKLSDAIMFASSPIAAPARVK